MIGIYKITNLKNGKVYVGQSIDIKDRWSQHKNKAFNSNERGYNSAIHAAFRKYGIENFSFEIIEECVAEQLDEKEQFWIKKFNSLAPNGYNILPGGQKNRLGKIWICEECGKQVTRGQTKCVDCARIYHAKGIKSKNDKPSPLELARMVKESGFVEVGRRFGVTDNSIRGWCKTYNIPFHTKELIAWYNSQMGIIQKGKKPYKKMVQQINKDTGEVIAIYESTREAARALGKSSCSHITEVCNEKLKTAYGYKWKYV